MGGVSQKYQAKKKTTEKKRKIKERRTKLI